MARGHGNQRQQQTSTPSDTVEEEATWDGNNATALPFFYGLIDFFEASSEFAPALTFVRHGYFVNVRTGDIIVETSTVKRFLSTGQYMPGTLASPNPTALEFGQSAPSHAVHVIVEKAHNA